MPTCLYECQQLNQEISKYLIIKLTINIPILIKIIAEVNIRMQPYRIWDSNNQSYELPEKLSELQSRFQKVLEHKFLLIIEN